MRPFILLQNRVFRDECADYQLNEVHRVRSPSNVVKTGSVPANRLLRLFGMDRKYFSFCVGLIGMDEVTVSV